MLYNNESNPTQWPAGDDQDAAAFGQHLVDSVHQRSTDDSADLQEKPAPSEATKIGFNGPCFWQTHEVSVNHPTTLLAQTNPAECCCGYTHYRQALCRNCKAAVPAMLIKGQGSLKCLLNTWSIGAYVDGTARCKVLVLLSRAINEHHVHHMMVPVVLQRAHPSDSMGWGRS